jgi:hypothetical protein
MICIRLSRILRQTLIDLYGPGRPTIREYAAQQHKTPDAIRWRLKRISRILSSHGLKRQRLCKRRQRPGFLLVEPLRLDNMTGIS